MAIYWVYMYFIEVFFLKFLCTLLQGCCSFVGCWFSCFWYFTLGRRNLMAAWILLKEYIWIPLEGCSWHLVGKRLGILLNSIQCTGESLTTNNHLAQMPIVTGLRNHALQDLSLFYTWIFQHLVPNRKMTSYLDQIGLSILVNFYLLYTSMSLFIFFIHTYSS